MASYLAGKFSSQARLRGVREHLNSKGWEVVSHWLDLVGGDYPPEWDEAYIERCLDEAPLDMAEVMEAKTIFIDTLDESATGGREVELGIALANGAYIIRVGPCRNVFHVLADEQYPSWEAFNAINDAVPPMTHIMAEITV